jgi:potassium efflux system protein
VGGRRLHPAARNLPGVLEIIVLKRLDIASGTRYAASTLSQYAIVAIGLVIAAKMLGAKWSNIQWLIAALSVGLGFGLQEIVANFVSGLIILFEQPIRVGDLVTVGDQIGTVSRIHIRATTIIDPDNREIIIPNKAIITDRVTNWALSDPVTRLVVKVGIAYGSDTALAHRVLLETVKANPLVLDSPPPTVFFLGFGDSSLNFEVRVYVREILNRIPLLHELHMAIDRALREHKIEIPFPQRDLHLRTVAAAIEVQQPRQD